MKLFVPTRYRTTSAEIMDDFTLEGEELRDALDKIAAINQLLGGNKITLDGINQQIEKQIFEKKELFVQILKLYSHYPLSRKKQGVAVEWKPILEFEKHFSN